MTIANRKTFTSEFKLEAAQLVVEHGYSTGEAALAMNVGKSTMSRWVRQLKSELNGTATHPTALTPDQRKIKELEKRIRQIEMEKDILKKATALLMSDSLNNIR
jgi:transposase